MDRILRHKEVMAVLSGLLLTASFPNIGLSGCAWFALVPLILTLKDLPPKSAFRIGYIAGLAHFLSLMYWLVHTMQTYGYLPWYLSIAVLFLLTAYLALYVAGFSYLLVRFCPAPVTLPMGVPLFWVSLEYIRAVLFTGLPWELLGYSQFRVLPLIQCADILGVYGVSWLIAAANAVIILVLLSTSRWEWQKRRVPKTLAGVSVLLGGVVFVTVWLYGNARQHAVEQMMTESRSAKITLIQGNIDQAIKWDPAFQESTTEKYVQMSLAAKEAAPDLVVWPETATPFYFLHDAELSVKVIQGILKTGTDFLIGSPSFIQLRDRNHYFNSAYLVRADGMVGGKYDKVHLVPFGEYVPFKRWLPFLGKMVAEVGDFKPGKEGRTIPWGDHRLGLQICYEIIFPNLTRRMAQNDADLIINITNDAWFGKTAAPHQHFSMAVFRAVENRKALVRAANTGISGFIDPVGRIPAQTGLFETARITRVLPLVSHKTFYTVYGDLFAYACLAAALLLALHRLITE